MKKLLTVVIPTYNMQDYLYQCLNSLVFEGFENYVEILVINDGSTDNSKEIANSFKKKYPKAFKIVNKTNGGYGSTLNTGLQLATGKYFKVLDADDSFNTENFKSFVNRLQNEESDLIVTDYTKNFENSQKSIECNNILKLSENKEQNICDTDASRRITMHCSCFKASIIKNMKFLEHCFYVDIEYIVKSYIKCKTVKYIPLNIYNYRLGRTGQSVSMDGFYKHRENHVLVLKTILELYEKEKKNLNDHNKIFLNLYIKELIKTQYTNFVLFYKNNNNISKEIIKLDNYLKDFKEFYDYSGTTVLKNAIFKLRKNNYKNLKYYYYKLKILIKLKLIFKLNK